MNCKIDKLAIRRTCIEATDPNENDTESCEAKIFKNKMKCYTRKISKPKKSLTRKVSKKEEPEPKPVKKIEEPEPEPKPVNKQEEDEEIENVNVIEYLQLSSFSTCFSDIGFEPISTFLVDEKFPENVVDLNKYLLED
jgi:hypothetical protein